MTSQDDAVSVPADREQAVQRHRRWRRIATAIVVSISLAIAVFVSRGGWMPRDRGVLVPSATGHASALTPEEQSRIAAVIAAGRVQLPAEVAALIRASRGASAHRQMFSPLSPIDTAVRAARPQFTWSDAGAEAYTVAVFDERRTEVARSPRLGGTSWTATEDLSRSSTYLWQVTAHRGDRNETEPQSPGAEAKFMVVDAATASRVDAMESRLAAEPLALGILLAEAGLVSDARVELARASKLRETAPAARRLLASLGPPASAR